MRIVHCSQCIHKIFYVTTLKFMSIWREQYRQLAKQLRRGHHILQQKSCGVISCTLCWGQWAFCRFSLFSNGTNWWIIFSFLKHIIPYRYNKKHCRYEADYNRFHETIEVETTPLCSAYDLTRVRRLSELNMLSPIREIQEETAVVVETGWLENLSGQGAYYNTHYEKIILYSSRRRSWRSRYSYYITRHMLRDKTHRLTKYKSNILVF